MATELSPVQPPVSVPHGGWLFLVIWLSLLVSNLGSTLSGMALLIWFALQNQSVTDVSQIMLALQLPGILALPVVGVFIDRWNRRSAMMCWFLGGTLSTLSLLALYELDLLTLELALLLTVLATAFVIFQGPTYVAAVTQILPRQMLPRASGLTQLAMGLTILLAALLAGLLIPLGGLRLILLVDLATFVFTLLALWWIRLPDLPQAGEQAPAPFWAGLWTSIRYLFSQPTLLALIGFLAVRMFFLGIFQVIIGVLLGSALGDATKALQAVAFGGLGMILGALVMVAWPGTQRFVRGLIGAELVIGVAFLIPGLGGTVVAQAAALFLLMLAIPFSAGWIQVLLQCQVPAEIQGRVFGWWRLLVRAWVPLGIAAAGPLGDRVFCPLLDEGGPLADSLGPWLGVGPAAGLNLLLVLLGLVSLSLTLGLWRFLQVRDPDAPQATLPR